MQRRGYIFLLQQDDSGLQAATGAEQCNQEFVVIYLGARTSAKMIYGLAREQTKQRGKASLTAEAIKTGKTLYIYVTENHTCAGFRNETLEILGSLLPERSRDIEFIKSCFYNFCVSYDLPVNKKIERYLVAYCFTL